MNASLMILKKILVSVALYTGVIGTTAAILWLVNAYIK